MRPRVFPAEDFGEACNFAEVSTGFNEAAGIPRGRRTARLRCWTAYMLASMRPRVFPAEDSETASSFSAAVTLQ